MSIQKKTLPKKSDKTADSSTPKSGKPSATVNSSDAVTPSLSNPVAFQ